MPTWTEGQRVRIISRPATDEDRKSLRYFPHMGGLVGTIQNTFAGNDVSICLDPACMSKVTLEVHKTAAERMHARFAGTSEEAKKGFTKEELEFPVNYVLLVNEKDLENE